MQDGLLLGEMVVNDDLVAALVCEQRCSVSVDTYRSPLYMRRALHGQRRRYSRCKIHDNHLVIHHVVVATIDATSVRSTLQCAHDAGGRAVQRYGIDRETVRIFGEAGQIHARSVVRALVSNRASVS